MSAILNSAILDSAILNKKPLHLFILNQLEDGRHLEIYQLGFSQFAQKNFTHTFWLILMMAAILNSAILNSVILDSTILNNKKLHSFILTQPDDGSHLEFYHLGFRHFAQKTSLIHCNPTWWWQPSWTLPCWIQPLPSWIQTPCYLLSDSLQNTLTPLWLWLKLIQSDSNSFILTQLDDGSHPEFHHHEFGHLGFSHFAQNSDSN